MKDQLRIFDVVLVSHANTMIRTYFEEVSKYMFVMYNRLDQREDCYKLNQFKDQLRDSFDKYIRDFDQPDNDRKIDIDSFSADSWKIYLPVLTKMAKLCDKEKIPLDESSALEENEKDELIGQESQQMILNLRNTVNSNTDRFIESPDIFLPSVARDVKNREGRLIYDSLVLHKKTVDKMIKKYLDENLNPKQDCNEISFADLHRINDILLYNTSLLVQATLLRSMKLNRSTTSKRE